MHVLASATSFFGVVGLSGLHAQEAKRTGWLGLLGAVLLSLWLIIIMGFSFVEAFILPHPGTVTSEFVDGWRACSTAHPATSTLVRCQPCGT